MPTAEELQAGRAALNPVSNIPQAPSPPKLNTAGNAKLGPEQSISNTDYVVFQYNPAAITIAHSAPVTPSTAKRHTNDKDNGQGQDAGGAKTGGTTPVMVSANDPESMARANGFTTIAVRALTFSGQFNGRSVAQTCMQLLKWTHFAKPQGTTQSTVNDALPRLKFVWGDDQIYLVQLTQVTINYTRFSATGKPVRAVVDLTLNSIPDIPGPTNPSSGGLEGRRSHLLTGAETLPALATQYYGGPGRWREIAAANGFEDPLRVRPGTRVYLPSEHEAGR